MQQRQQQYELQQTCVVSGYYSFCRKAGQNSHIGLQLFPSAATPIEAASLMILIALHLLACCCACSRICAGVSAPGEGRLQHTTTSSSNTAALEPAPAVVAAAYDLQFGEQRLTPQNHVQAGRTTQLHTVIASCVRRGAVCAAYSMGRRACNRCIRLPCSSCFLPFSLHCADHRHAVWGLRLCLQEYCLALARLAACTAPNGKTGMWRLR
jgi:hypothetical protein